MFKKILLLSLVYLFSLQAQEFQSPVTISEGDASVLPQIAFNRTNPNNAIAVWVITDGAGPNTIVQAANTTNGGVTWSSPQNISLPELNGNLASPQIAFGNDNNAIAVWSIGNGVFQNIIQSASTTDGGATWSAAVDVFNTEAAFNPVLAISEDGSTAVAVWNTIDVSTKQVLMTARSIDGGATWVNLTTLTNLASVDAVFFQVKFGQGGNAIIVWNNNFVPATPTIQSAYTIDLGLNWTPGNPADIATPGTTSLPQIAFGQGGVAVIEFAAFDGVDKFKVQTASTGDEGANWNAPVDASELHDAVTGAGIAFSQDGTAAIAVYSVLDGLTPDAFIQAATSNNQGTSWDILGIQNISTPGAQVGLPQITFADGLNAIAIWFASIDGNYFSQTATTSNGGISWESPVNISTPEILVQTPQIAVGVPAFTVQANTSMLGATPNLLGGEVIIGIWSGQRGAETTTFIRASSTNQVQGFSVSGEQISVDSLFQRDLVNQISWNSMPAAVSYTVLDGNNTVLFQGNALTFSDHNKKKGQEYTYTVFWTDGVGTQSPSVTITVP